MNPIAEGIDEIYQVEDGKISLRIDPARPEVVDKAREELALEEERLREEEEEKRKYKQLVESMNERPF